MDEANQLVQALQLKLCELDHRIWKYRQDMVAEFDKYAVGLLNDVPVHLSETVLEGIKESKKLYKSLYPEADTELPVESCAAGSNTTTAASTVHNGSEPDSLASPNTMPMSIPTSEKEGGEKDSSPRDPHAREKEFEGVFTPKYLPLLDDSDRNERRSSATIDTPLSPRSEAKGKGKQIEEDVTHADASTDTRSLQNSPIATKPPTPKRRNTDEVSIKSDWSDGPARRSALRRSSSTSQRHSPRRVRFEVEGQEVLPTVSPAQISSTLGEMAGLSFEDSFEEVEEEAGSEQIEDVDEEPIQKRVSSSQALRALSRAPIDDDGTQWTTVSAPPDGSASVATTNGFTYGLNNNLPEFGTNFEEMLDRNSQGHLTNRESAGTEQSSHLAETPSDDETLDIMSPLRRQKQLSATILSPAKPADIEGNKSPTASTRPSGALLHSFSSSEHTITKDNDLSFDDDQDVMFNFDENVTAQGAPSPRQPRPSDSDSDSEPELLIKPRRPSSQASSFSRSPARDIIRPAAVTPSATSFNTTPTRSSSGIVGSFKGQPFGMPIVNKELHDQAAAMDVDTHFGSLKDRRGGERSSYSRSSNGVGSFSGAPRSFSERAMMDDIMEAEAEENKINMRNGGRDS